MRHLVRPATVEDLRWLCQWADCKLSNSAFGLAAVDSFGRIRGVVAYDEVTATECRAHQAGTPGAVRALIPMCFVLPFEALGLEKLVGTVASTNSRALRFNRHLGFREVRRESDGFGGGVDKVWMELRRDECRVLKRRKAAA